MPENMDVTPVEAGAVVDEAPETSRGETDSGDGKLDDGGIKALREEREARKRLERELRQIRKAEQDRADAEKSELQRAQEAAQRLEAELTAAKRAAFAASEGVPEGLLTGATPDEWKASATALLEFAQTQKPAPKKPSQLRSGTSGLTPATAPGERTANALKSIFGT